VLFENGQRESLLYLLGLLNSRLLTFRFKSIGKLKGNGIYEYFWNSVSRLSIRRIDFTNPEDRSIHDRLVELVTSMQELQKELASETSTLKKITMQRQIDATDTEIDKLTYRLYGFTSDEIARVEKANAELVKTMPETVAVDRILEEDMMS
jgi:hypothetical protein